MYIGYSVKYAGKTIPQQWCPIWFSIAKVFCFVLNLLPEPKVKYKWWENQPLAKHVYMSTCQLSKTLGRDVLRSIFGIDLARYCAWSNTLKLCTTGCMDTRTE